MGDSKRRKQLDPNYGKGGEMPPIIREYADALRRGDTAIAVGRMEDETGEGADILSPIEIKSLGRYLSLVYDMSIPAYRKGLSYQEKAKGILSLMPADYLRACGIDDGNGGHVVFDWFTVQELGLVPRQSLYYNNTNLLKPLTLWLASVCELGEIPVLWNGVPIDDASAANPTIGRCNLLYVLNQQSAPVKQAYPAPSFLRADTDKGVLEKV